jgi:tagatose-1,6-bisphosphate aldolase
VADSVPLTPGKVRGLSATSTPEGLFNVLAIDHRDSLRVVLDPAHPETVPASVLTDIKLDLLAGLADGASAVMLEPEYSAAQAIASRRLPGSVGFLAAVEAQGYLGDPTARQTTVLEGWSVEKAKRLGANGIKLLVLYRPDGGEVSETQERTIADVVDDCAGHDIPLFLEPLLYEDETTSPGERRALVVDTVRRLGALRPDILKVQFPVDTAKEPDRGAWRDACAELDDAAPVPWALLSGGGTYERFREQLEIACAAGASGFMVGRALWGEYVAASPEDRPALLRTTLRPRFAELAAIAGEHGRDWAAHLRLPHVDERWYLSY